MAPKGGRGGGGRGGSRGGSRSWGSSSKGSSWFGSKSKGSSSKSSSKGFFSWGKSKNKNKSSSYPKQQGFTSYTSGGKTVSNANWPKNQIPAAGTFPKQSSFGTNSYGMNKISGMGTMGSMSAMKSTMKSKGYYNTAVKLGTAYVGYKAAKGVGKTIGKAMWMGYPRLYGNQAYFYGMSSQYRYLGAVNEDCDVFYDIMGGREMLRCDDWGNNRYSGRYGSNYNDVASTIMGIASWLFFTILICCCCCCGGCIYFFKKQSKSQNQGEDIDSNDDNQIPLNAQQPPPMFEPQNPYPSDNTPKMDNYNPYPTPMASTNPYPTPMAPATGANPYPAPFNQPAPGNNPYPVNELNQSSAPPPTAFDAPPYNKPENEVNSEVNKL